MCELNYLYEMKKSSTLQIKKCLRIIAKVYLQIAVLLAILWV